MSTRSVILSTGHGLPRTIVTNDDLAEQLETSDEWIAQRTGIRQRRVCQEDEGSGSLSVLAGREALERSGLTATDIDMVICATVSGDFIWPATACRVQEELGITGAAFDVSAACAGFVYAMDVAASMIEAGRVTTALVIGVDCLTKQVDWTDRSTCVLFGDGAGAVVMQAAQNTDRGLLGSILLSDGSGAKHIWVEVGGTRNPFGSPQAEGKSRCISMNGKEVYRFAVKAMGDACEKVLEKTGLTAGDIDLFVPHQANLRIITAAAERLGLPEDKIYLNVQKYGNTSAGSIPLALHEAVVEGRLKPGMTVLTVGFGAGLVWGANIIRW